MSMFVIVCSIGSAAQLKGQFQKAFYFFIHVVYRIHAEMVIELFAIARYLRDLLKAKVVGICFVKRKDHVHKILPDVGDPGDALSPGGNADHGFCRMKLDGATFVECGNQVIKQHFCLASLQKILDGTARRTICFFHGELKYCEQHCFCWLA